jgi:hypothetical protein
MQELDLITPLKVFSLTGRVGTGAGTARAAVGYSKAGDLFFASGIYQNRLTKKGKISTRTGFYTYVPGSTAPQLARRSVFSDGMSAWMSLTDEEKLVYDKRARRVHMFGANLFMKEYLKNH